MKNAFRILAFLLVLVPSVARTQTSIEKSQGELRFDAAQGLLQQDLKALATLKESKRYSQTIINKLLIRVQFDDSRLILLAGLVLEQELNKARSPNIGDYFVKEAISTYDEMVPAIMHDRKTDGLPKELITTSSKDE